MAVSPLAGKPPPPRTKLIDVAQLKRAYYERRSRTPSMQSKSSPSARAGIAVRARWTFTEAHILAITQAIATIAAQGIDGPLYMGKDTHAFGAGRADCAGSTGRQRRRDFYAARDGFTPTPVISRAILYTTAAAMTIRRRHRRSRPRTILRRTADSSTTHPMAVRPTPTSRAGSGPRQ